MALQQDVRKLWSNGARSLLIALAFLIGAGLIFASASVFALVSLRDDSYEPLDFKVPQHVVTKGPIAPGGIVEVVGIKCNTSTEDVAVEGKSYYRNLTTLQLTLNTDATAIRPPGCVSFDYHNRVPMTLEPGRYRIEGVEIARSGTNIQQEPYYSEEFCIGSEDTC